MENHDSEKVCEECKKQTKISYKYVNDFFAARRGSLNKLDAAPTGLMYNFVARIAEWFYKQYEHIRNWFGRLNNFLFPRRDKIWGSIQDSYITARLVYASRYAPRTPLRHIKVEFWARTRWWKGWQWRNIASGFCDNEGYVHLPFDLRAARNFSIKSKLRFEIHHTSHIYFKDNEKPKPFTACTMSLNFQKVI
jgi:hypothetical protein